MPIFKVTLERRIAKRDEPTNPFTPIHISMNARSEYSLRSWEFEAKDEREARKLLDEAYEQKIPNVMGYRLRSIERVEPESLQRGTEP